MIEDKRPLVVVGAGLGVFVFLAFQGIIPLPQTGWPALPSLPSFSPPNLQLPNLPNSFTFPDLSNLIPGLPAIPFQFQIFIVGVLITAGGLVLADGIGEE